jgi:hypothetical protein
MVRHDSLFAKGSLNCRLEPRHNGVRVEPSLPAGDFQRFASARIVNSKLFYNSQELRVLDEPVGNARV